MNKNVTELPNTSKPNNEITTDEILKAVRSLKNGKVHLQVVIPVSIGKKLPLVCTGNCVE